MTSDKSCILCFLPYTLSFPLPLGPPVVTRAHPPPPLSYNNPYLCFRFYSRTGAASPRSQPRRSSELAILPSFFSLAFRQQKTLPSMKPHWVGIQSIFFLWRDKVGVLTPHHYSWAKSKVVPGNLNTSARRHVALSKYNTASQCQPGERQRAAGVCLLRSIISSSSGYFAGYHYDKVMCVSAEDVELRAYHKLKDVHTNGLPIVRRSQHFLLGELFTDRA